MFLKALNENQLFLLENVDGVDSSLTSFLKKLCNKHDKSLSTLKHNARVLRDFDLIEYGSKNNPEPVTLTEHGQTLLYILNSEESDKDVKNHE